MVPEGFYHNEQSLRIVDLLERDGRGLNLTLEVRDGILKHSKGRYKPIMPTEENRPMTLEGQTVRLADVVAYLNHDLDDALRAELLKPGDIPETTRRRLGIRHSQRIHAMVEDIVVTSLDAGLESVRLSSSMLECVNGLRTFLFENVYDVPQVRRDFERVRKIIEDLHHAFCTDDEVFRSEIGEEESDIPRERRIFDHIAGMTDRYVLDLYKRLFLPRPWMKM